MVENEIDALNLTRVGQLRKNIISLLGYHMGIVPTYTGYYLPCTSGHG